MSDMYFRSLLGRGRKLLGRMRVGETTDQSAGSYSLLALRLERDLVHAGRGRGVLVTATDDDAVAIEAAVELSWCLGEELGHSVLVIDAGFGDGALSGELGMRDRTGLAEALDAPSQTFAALEPHITATHHPRVFILPHGVARGATVRGEAIRALLSAVRERFDFVLVQGSLAEEAERTLAFGSLVDATLLFAVEELSTIDDIARGQRLLNDCGARRVALVLGNRQSVRVAQPTHS